MSKDTSNHQGAEGREAASVAQGDVFGRGVDDKVSVDRGQHVDGKNPVIEPEGVSDNEPQPMYVVDPHAPVSSAIVRDFIPADSEPTKLEAEKLQFTFSTPREAVKPDFFPDPKDEPFVLPDAAGARAEAEAAAVERGKRAVADRADELAGQFDHLNDADAIGVFKDLSPHDQSLALIVEAEGRNRKLVLDLGEPDPDVFDALEDSRTARGDYDVAAEESVEE